MFREITPEKKREIYLRAVIDFLKVNSFRIAAHSTQKDPSPLSSRSDLKPLLPLVIDKEGGENLDILALDDKSRITFCRACLHEDLVAHYYSDELFIKSLKTALESGETIHFIFITNGIIMPDLVLKAEWDQLIAPLTEISERIPIIDFYETRIDPMALVKLNNHKIYQRKIISSMKRLHQEYFESDVDCGDGELAWEGKYDIHFHDKSVTLPYWIGPDSGAQFEGPENPNKIANFVSGFR
ncbi:MAG: hypothetical protein ACXAC7_00730 [Candidatus Hodarchaeales archaeon]|jgi:hypothetical protein